MPKYPNIRVRLIGNDGNGMAVIGAVRRALRKAGVPDEEIDEFTKAAKAGDYDNLLRVADEWVGVE